MFIPRALYSPNYETGIMYEVKINQFSGPLEKLLELIEEKKMEITALSLAEVTGGFFNYVKRVESDIDPKILADFLVVAAKLVLIKSKALLPGLELTQEEELDIKDLEQAAKYGGFLKRQIGNEFRRRPIVILVGGGMVNTDDFNEIADALRAKDTVHIKTYLELLSTAEKNNEEFIKKYEELKNIKRDKENREDSNTS